MEISTEDVDKAIKEKKSRSWIKNNLLLITTLAGVVIGLVAGTTLRRFHFSNETIFLISYPGELFMRILKLMTLPLLISSLINVSASLNARLNGKIAIRTFVYFVVTTMLSSSMGICIALVFQPSNVPRIVPTIPTKHTSKLLDNILDLGRNIFPDNLFQATFQQTVTIYSPPKDTISAENNTEPNMIREVTSRSGVNTIGIVVFCLAFGIILSTIGEKGVVIKQFFSAIFEIMLKMIKAVIWLSGIGVASIITAKLLSIDNLLEITSQLGIFLFCVMFGIMLHQTVLLPLIYFIFIRKNPYKFLIKLVDAWVTAFAVCSSAVTLPTTLHCMNVKLRSDSRISNFVVTLGVNLNTNATVIYFAIASMFVARLNGETLEFSNLIVILLVSTTTSMSMPSVPSGSIVMLLVVLSAIDVDPQNVSLLFAVEWLLDRLRTTSNVLDDCFAAAVVEKLSKKDLIEMDLAIETKPENTKLLQNV